MGKIPKEILAIIIIGLILRILYAFLNPDFNSLDELPHLKYIKSDVADLRNSIINQSLKMSLLASVILFSGVIHPFWLISKSRSMAHQNLLNPKGGII